MCSRQYTLWISWDLNALVLFAINVNQVKVVKVTVFGATPFSTSVNNNTFADSIY